MDIMEMRFRMMAMMGGGEMSQFATGIIEPTADTWTGTINVGFPIKSFSIFVTEKTYVSGKRQLIGINYVENDNKKYELGIYTNSQGVSLASRFITEDSTSTPAISVNGNSVTYDVGQLTAGTRLISERSYRWVAYA